MMECNKKHFKKALACSSLLAAPLAVSIGFPTSLYAACSVTSGGGTLANPVDGTVITCSGTTAVVYDFSDNTKSATITLDAGASLTFNDPAENGILLDTATINIGNNGYLDGNDKYAIKTVNNINITAGDDVTIQASHTALYSDSGSLALTIGDNATLYSEDNILIEIDQDIVLKAGDNASFEGKYATIQSNNGGATITLGNDGSIESNGHNIYAQDDILLIAGNNFSSASTKQEAIYSETGNINIRLGDGAYIYSGRSHAIEAQLNLAITLGNNATIISNESGIESTDGNIQLTAGDNFKVTSATYYGIHARNGDATITLGDNAYILTSGDSDGIYTDNDLNLTAGDNLKIIGYDYALYSKDGHITLNLGDNASITNDGDNRDTILSYNNITITAKENLEIIGEDKGIRAEGNIYLYLGNDTYIQGEANAAIQSDDGDIVIKAGDNFKAHGDDHAIYAESGDVTIELGNNAYILATGDSDGIYADQSITLTAGDNFKIVGYDYALYSDKGHVTLNLGDNASITNNGNDRDAIYADQNITLTAGDNFKLIGEDGGIYANDVIYLYLGDNAYIKGETEAAIRSDTNDIVIKAGDNFRVHGDYYGIYAGIGNATIELGDNAYILAASDRHGIYADYDVTLTAGDNFKIVGYDSALYSDEGNITLTLGNNAILRNNNGTESLSSSDIDTTITAKDNFSAIGEYGGFLAEGDIDLELGDNAYIKGKTSTAIESTNDITVNAGDNAKFYGNNDVAIKSDTGNIALYTGDSATITGTTGGINSVTGQAIVTLGSRSNVTTTTGNAITNASNINIGYGSQIVSSDTTSISGTANQDIIINAGLIQGATNSLLLNDGNDRLTLQTGSNLSGIADGGGGIDGIILQGTGSEDNNFNNFEQLTMAGDQWTLSGTFSLNNLIVDSGALSIDGALTVTSVQIDPLGTLKGSGTITGPISNSGTIAPGNSIGTQTIVGSLSLNEQSTLEIEFNPTQNDIINVTGAATLNGTLSLQQLGNDIIAADRNFTFLNVTDTITGTFDTIIDSVLSLDPIVTINDQTIDVAFEESALSKLLTTGSESAVLNAIQDNNLSDISTIINNVTSAIGQSDLLASQGALIHGSASTASFQTITNITDGIVKRLQNNHTKHTPSALSENRVPSTGIATGDTVDNTEQNIQNIQSMPDIKIWTNSNAGFGSIDRTSKVRGTEYKIWNLTFGAEKEVSPDVSIGAFGALSNVQTNTIDTLKDTAATYIYQAGLYNGSHFHGWNMSNVIAASLIQTETSRPTPLGVAKADFGGSALSAATELSYDITHGGWVISPLLGLDLGVLKRDAILETGAGILNSHINKQSSIQLNTKIGSRFSREFTTDTLSIIPSASLAWKHTLGDDDATNTVGFSSAPAVSFNSFSPETGKDSLLMGLDLSLMSKKSDHMHVYLNYDGEISSKHSEHAVQTGIKVKY